MPDKTVSKTEGDVNLTEERARWQKTFISEESQKLLE